jgi:hypothetical protein
VVFYLSNGFFGFRFDFPSVICRSELSSVFESAHALTVAPGMGGTHAPESRGGPIVRMLQKVFTSPNRLHAKKKYSRLNCSDAPKIFTVTRKKSVESETKTNRFSFFLNFYTILHFNKFCRTRYFKILDLVLIKIY